MALGEIDMLSECPHCAQKLRSNWVRCPRCRTLLADSPRAAPVASPHSFSSFLGIERTWLMGLAAGLCAFIGTAMLSPGSAPPSASAAVAPVTAPEAPGAVPDRGDGVISTKSVESVNGSREASSAYSQGDYAGALARLESAVAASPENGDVRNNLAQVLVRQGRAAEALPHLDEAVRLDGQRWAYRFNRARAYGLVGRWTDAVAEYRVAAALFPDDHATLYNLGLASMRVKDYTGAVDALERAVSAAPDDHDFLVTLGTAYMGAEQPERARETFARYLDVSPDGETSTEIRALLQGLTAPQP